MTSRFAFATILASFATVALGAAGCGPTGNNNSCDPPCGTGLACVAGACVPEVTPDLSVSVPDLASNTCTPACSGDTPHCSAQKVCVPCLMDSHCPAGKLCKSALGQNQCVPGCTDDARCNAGGMGPLKCCGGQCVDPTKDSRHCGACDQACMSNHTQASCTAGKCTAGMCHAGYGDCDNDPANGCETYLRADAMNCGMCGSKCDIKNAINGCSGGTCYVRACQFGFDDCDRDEKNGCETPVASDPKNCGACGKVCNALPNAKAACINSVCGVTGCNLGFGDCDGNAANGCETNIFTNAANCGGCGMACPQGLVCVNGGCTCNNCTRANATTKCINNVCTLDRCVAGFSNCDNNDANGCEINLNTDAKNCSACGMACPMNLPACVNGVCSNARKCSEEATAWCMAKGWKISPWQTAWPNQPGGSIFCTQNGSAAADCDSCNTYAQLIWKNGAKDACSSPMVLVPGKVYGGHNPCSCQANNFDCGVWDMKGCIPD